MTDLEAAGNMVRYGLAVLMMITVPPAILYWFIIHPLAGRLRRFGPAPTFAVLVPALVACSVLLFMVRDRLVGADLGWSPPIFAVGVVLYAISVRIELRVREHLKFRVLAGVPELGADPGRLLTEGIYAELRHPRYLSLLVGLLAYALMVNYGGLYVLFLGAVVGIAAIIRLEDRELVARFGEPYVQYRARVPAIVPKEPGGLLRGGRARTGDDP